MEGPLSQQHIDDIVTQQPTEPSGDIVISHEHAQLCINGLGLWMIEAVGSLKLDKVCGLVISVCKLFVEAADGILQIVCERGSYNESLDQLPVVFPHEFY